MTRELKVRIDDYRGVEKVLRQKGAAAAGTIQFIDTYFRQPEGKVLKIAEKNGKYFLTMLQAVDGRFEFLKDESLDDPKPMLAELTKKYGVKRVLKGKRLLYELQGYTLTLNLIDEVGDFLIVGGEQPPKSFVEQDLGIKNPEYITVSFDNLGANSRI